MISTGQPGRSSKIHDLQAKAFEALADIDARRAIEMAKHIPEFAKYGTNRARSITFSSFEEIIAFRAKEAGARSYLFDYLYTLTDLNIASFMLL
jgi:hypothetical protein